MWWKSCCCLSLLGTCMVLFSGNLKEMPPYLPPEREIVRKTFLSAEDVLVRQKDGSSLMPRMFLEKRDLGGSWKFSGVRLSAQPFPATAELDKGYADPAFRDSAWHDIKVPLNWYRDPRFSYGKLYRKKQPYAMAWYRRTFDLPAEQRKGRRVLLHFDVIGYEGLVFVNGKQAGHAHGDFVPSEFDITDLLVSGKNTLAVRVFSDFGIIPGSGQKSYRTYGAKWWWENVKAGLWQPVYLTLEPEIRFDGIRIASDFAGNALEIRGNVVNHTPQSRTAVLSGVVTDADRASANEQNTARDFPLMTLKPGVTPFRVRLPLNRMKAWEPANANLYFLTLLLKEKNRVVTAKTERFGFRELKTKGNTFLLNGKRIYLFGENISSTDFGGFDRTPEQENAMIRDQIKQRLKAGVVLLRTAHMPPVKAVIQAADELGMMIYDEWSYSFTIPEMDESRFEKTNLDELAGFLGRDFNAPSVVMWSLGNEVQHGTRPEAFRQLSKQIELVRKTDFQKRPLVPFSGVAAIAQYGSGKFDADVLDLHSYHGLVDKPWTHYQAEMNNVSRGIRKVYRDPLPWIVWECIGYTWGNHINRTFKTGNVEEYLKYAKGKFDWAQPRGIGYAAATGLASMLDPERGIRYAMDRQAGRLFDLFRQDPRFQGFASWCMPPDLPQRMRWNQPVYATLRTGDSDLPPHNLFAGERCSWKLFLTNDSSAPLENPVIRVSLAGREFEERSLGSVKFPTLAPGEQRIRPLEIRLPEWKQGLPFSAQIRLTVVEKNGREVCRNYANVILEAPDLRSAPVRTSVRIGLIESGAWKTAAEFLNAFKIPYRTEKPGRNLKDFDTLILPPDSSLETQKQAEEAIRQWVENGGCLVLLEQKPGALPVYPQYLCTSDANSFADLVLPQHPLFREMGQEQFDLWSESPNGDVLSSMISPITENVLAAKPPFLVRNTVGMAVMEAKAGKGWVIASQLNASRNWKKESAATRYLRNLLEYAGNRPLRKEARPLASVTPAAYQAETEDLVMLDLSPWANRSFRDETDHDGKGGWTDQGTNDFRIMPKGKITAAGIPFRIIDPDQNNGKGCLIVRGSARKAFPPAIRGIRIGGRFSRLFFLHTSAWGNAGTCGKYLFRYSDGSVGEYLLKGGRNIGDWWQVKQLPEARIGFTRKNASGAEIGFFVAEWVNPHPEKRIESMEFHSAIQEGLGGVDWVDPNASVPVLAAVTGEKYRGKALPVYSGTTKDQPWWGMAWRGGEKPKIQLIKTGNKAPAPYAVRFDLPEGNNKGVPVVSMRYDFSKIRDNVRCLIFRVKTHRPGVIDVVFPSKDWKSCFMATVSLNEPGRWVTIRLPFRSAFRYTGAPFPIRESRKEIYLYNGLNQQNSYPRSAVSFELTGMELQ